MENFYTAYTKTINGVTHHFVKHFQTFPEYKNVSPLLENYGMHVDFYKACRIAMIRDKCIQKQLLDTVIVPNTVTEVICINHNKTRTNNYRNWLVNVPGVLNWIGMRKLLHFK